MIDVYAEFSGELHQLEADLNALVTGDLAHLNEMAKSLDVPEYHRPRQRTAREDDAKKVMRRRSRTCSRHTPCAVAENIVLARLKRPSPACLVCEEVRG